MPNIFSGAMLGCEAWWALEELEGSLLEEKVQTKRDNKLKNNRSELCFFKQWTRCQKIETKMDFISSFKKKWKFIEDENRMCSKTDADVHDVCENKGEDRTIQMSMKMQG